MKRAFISFAFFLFIILWLGCNKKEQSGCEPINSNCQQISCGNSLAWVCYIKTLGDSRCPANAVCVWQGKADAELQFMKDGKTILFRLSTLAVQGSYPTDTTIQNIHIRLKQVLPYPGLPGSGGPGVELDLSCK